MKVVETKRRFGIEHFSIEGYKLTHFLPTCIERWSIQFIPQQVRQTWATPPKKLGNGHPSYKSSTRKLTCWWVWPHFSTFAFMCSLRSKGNFFFPQQRGKGFRATNFGWKVRKCLGKKELLHMSCTSQSSNVNYLEILCHPVVIFQSWFDIRSVFKDPK